MKQPYVSFRKTNDEKRIVFGEVYAPNIPDSQGDFMQAEEIERISYQFMAEGRVHKIDTEHSLNENGSVVVESFIAREGDLDFVPGAWVLAVHIPDMELWGMVKTGEINGYSMYGTGTRRETTLQIEVPDNGILKGDTGLKHEHQHQFMIRFDDAGNFLGGETSVVNDHKHVIKRGTVTEDGGGDFHNHTYSFVEALAA